MDNVGLIVIIVGIVLWISHNRSGAPSKIPSWLFKGIGIFLIIVLVLNISEALAFLRSESDSWWPIVEENGQNFSKWLRELIRTVTGG